MCALGQTSDVQKKHKNPLAETSEHILRFSWGIARNMFTWITVVAIVAGRSPISETLPKGTPVCHAPESISVLL